MQINLDTDRDIKSQAIAAGFATVEDYMMTLLDRDAERLAIQEGIEDMNAGRMQPWAEADAEIRKEVGFAPRS